MKVFEKANLFFYPFCDFEVENDSFVLFKITFKKDDGGILQVDKWDPHFCDLGLARTFYYVISDSICQELLL